MIFMSTHRLSALLRCDVIRIRNFYSSTVQYVKTTQKSCQADWIDCRPREKLTKSYVFGSSNLPLLGLTVGQLLQRAAEEYRDRDAVVVVHQNIRKSFQEILHDADRVAAGLLSLGLERGDRIGIWGPNSYEWVLTQWAAARAGLTLVNVNPAYQAEELQYALNLVGVKALVVAETYRKQSLLEILRRLVPQLDPGHHSPHAPKGFSHEGLVHSPQVPSLQRVIIMTEKIQNNGALRWQDLIDSGSSTWLNRVHDIQEKIQFDEPANIQFTSGTTGHPKGATLSHHNIINNANFVGYRIGYHMQPHVICVPVPLYHCFGCNTGVLTGALHGASCVFPSPVFSARATIKAVHDEKCTSLYGTPTMFIDMLHHPELKQYDMSSLSTGIMAGAPCPIEVARGAIDKLNMKNFSILYGMTECSPATFQTIVTDSVEVRCSTIGYPSEHVEAKIVDPTTKEIVPVNTPGEIWTRGYNTMLGYWNDSVKTNEVITKDRWMRSGDLGVMNENGYGRIVGRIKDMIIRGGENIFPREVEEILYTHPGIQDAQVIGVPDERLGEEICAWIKCKPEVTLNIEDLKEFCSERMAYFKVPRFWMLKETFPMTVTGKIQKFVMREISIKELKL